MNSHKDAIKKIILGDCKNFKRFEMMESFAAYAEGSEDIRFLLNVLKNDSSSVVRHEAAAQLLKIEQKKPWLIEPLKDVVIEELLNVVLSDRSLVARHESVEALSYIGDSKVLVKLEEILSNEDNKDELLETVQIARDTIEYRLIKNIDASELSNSIMRENLS